MKNTNKVVEVGRFTKEHVVRYGGADKNFAVLSNSIAVNRGKDKVGNDLGTDFFDVVAYGKLCETLEKYTRKGSRILVCGSLRQDRYDTKDGKKASRTVIEVRDVEFLDSKKAETANGGAEEFVNIPDDTSELPFN